ncbi:hypothetical protein PGRAN_02715 [Listeria grandensis FSL F6-0971]|uniref:Phage protein Gp138 N-terminal domain-containing protein n=1 Tax=Listeria grandensis FSL F6-0971 TaxID=1265819 RepID=W7BJ42_9LIST|nr:hypothetical protein [Listeria grandensis]EUJ24770.1 hypothetical protein PGRAN_02715 [Listeria grandensis FSL F6-0971]
MANDTKFWDTFSRSIIMKIHTLAPARVLELNSDKTEAQVQPLFLTKDNDGNMLRQPSVPAVVLKHCRDDIKVDDVVFIIAAERSLDNFEGTNEFIDPDDVRTHALQDSVIVGVY